jgi:DUF1009 family protein
MEPLGIIAGGGDLPIAIAQCAREAGRRVFIAGLRGIAGSEVEAFEHAWVSVGETGRAFRLLHEHECRDVLVAGKVARPTWADIKLDTRGMLHLPKVMAAARKGDDALLRSFVGILEGEGFRVVSAAEAAPALLSPEGVLGKIKPSAQDRADIDLAQRTVRALGALDIGQAAVVADGLVLAVEAAEGTDAMIARVASLPSNIRGAPGKRKGVLVKARKPTQDGKTDLPVIGVHTVANAAAVSLAGIAVEAGNSLIVNRQAAIEAADRAGLFLLGFPQSSGL